MASSLIPEGEVIVGDCLDVMATWPEESVDAIVTDPPYNLTDIGRRFQGQGGTLRPDGGPRSESRGGGFMGKAWDGTGIAFRPETWELALRIAKPSAYLLAFGGTRTVHRLTCALEDAGWIIRDLLVWAYASGFPKSKASLKPAWEPIVMARKPGPLRMLAIDECRIGSVGGTTRSHQAEYGESGWRTGHDILPVEGGRWPANVILTDPIFDGDSEGVVGGGEASTHGGGLDKVSGETPGWGSISVKQPGRYIEPDSGTYSRFFTIPESGTMCEWCGASGAEPSSSQPSGPDASAPSPAPTEASSGATTRTASPTTSVTEQTSWHSGSGITSRNEPSPASRLVVPSRSDPARLAGPNGTSSATTTTTRGRWMCASCAEDAMRFSMAERDFAERNYPWAFLIPKADRADREPVLGGLATMDRDLPLVGLGAKFCTLCGEAWVNPDGWPRCGHGRDNTGRRPPLNPKPRANVHPTVKPTELMRHLVRLVTPTGGLVLDPFLGSGTTALAAEQEGFRWVGIEREAEYADIARARLNGTQRGLGLDIA